MDGCFVIRETGIVKDKGTSANLNTNPVSSQRRYITYRRANEKACNSLAAIDVCVIIKSKGETAPHSFNEIPKNLNNNIFGASIFLCYKKALISAKHIKYLPKVLFRYPQADASSTASYKFPLQVSSFGLPMGAMIESWPSKIAHQLNSHPQFSTFVLNVNDGGATITKIYGACLTFYENFNKMSLSVEQAKILNYDLDSQENDNILKVNKCMLLLSQHPFFESFKKLLFFLHKLCYNNMKTSISIERYISHFINNIPFPTVQKPRVLVSLTHEDEVSFYLPEESILPQSGASFVELLKNLGSENCTNVLLYVLLQKSIMVHSLRPAVLTGVVEAISCIIFPFFWNYTYIPMLPLSKCDMIEAPGSYIFGMDSRYFDMFDTPSIAICVDLDTNSISLPDDCKNLNSKQMPKRAVNTLKNRLNSLSNEINDLMQIKRELNKVGYLKIKDDIEIKRRERECEISIREEFLRFMIAILQNYKSYLRTGTRRPDIKAKDRNISTYYDISAFIRSRDSSSQSFYKELVQTQLFNDFIINISFLSELDQTIADSLAFFDDCCNRVVNSNTSLLKLNRFINDQTIVILPPEPLSNNSDEEFLYNGLPDLKFENFCVGGGDENINCDTYCNQHNDDLISSNKRLINTPMGIRSKAEKLQAQQRLDSQFSANRSSKSWSYCLLSNAYALWFIYLPFYLETCESKVIGLNNAFKVLVKMQKQLLTQPDEVNKNSFSYANLYIISPFRFVIAYSCNFVRYTSNLHSLLRFFCI